MPTANVNDCKQVDLQTANDAQQKRFVFIFLFCAFKMSLNMLNCCCLGNQQEITVTRLMSLASWKAAVIAPTSASCTAVVVQLLLIVPPDSAEAMANAALAWPVVAASLLLM